MSDKLILLVEDNPDDLELTLRALRAGNVASNIIVARDGVEALDYVFASGAYAHRQADSMPAVILLDLKLPKVNGLEVLQRLREVEQTKLLPVVVLTSSDEQSDILEVYNLGANSYVRKPVDFDDFTQAVQQLGLYWLLVNEPPPIR